MTASKEAWDRPDMGVTCPHRCDGVLLQPLVAQKSWHHGTRTMEQETLL
jgi:hypothetical protein